MNLPRTLRVLLLCSLLAFIGHVPTGVGQVPAEDFPFDLRQMEDYGSFRVSLETAWDQWSLLPGSVEFRGVSFVPVLEFGSTRIFSGRYRAVVSLPIFAVAGSMYSPVIDHPRRMAYVHTLGQPCDIPPDSYFESPDARALAIPQRGWNAVRTGTEMELLLQFLEWMETGDPAQELGGISDYAQVGSNWTLSRFRLSKSGAAHRLELLFSDLIDPAIQIDHCVEAVWNGSLFTQVIVR